MCWRAAQRCVSRRIRILGGIGGRGAARFWCRRRRRAPGFRVVLGGDEDADSGSLVAAVGERQHPEGRTSDAGPSQACAPCEVVNVTPRRQQEGEGDGVRSRGTNSRRDMASRIRNRRTTPRPGAAAPEQSHWLQEVAGRAQISDTPSCSSGHRRRTMAAGQGDSNAPDSRVTTRTRVSSLLGQGRPALPLNLMTSWAKAATSRSSQSVSRSARRSRTALAATSRCCLPAAVRVRP